MNYNRLYDKLKFSPIPKVEFLNYIANIIGLCEDFNVELEILKASGFPLLEEDKVISLSTKKIQWQEQIFCFVDIETTGSKPKDSSMIEIGALKYKYGQIIDRFESFVYAKEVPEKIVELTGITAKTIENSPHAKEVLKKFRSFLGDSIFVAHNVNFDYEFMSYHMNEIGLNYILNPKLCTIDLARRTILSPRYSLAFLNAFLGINTPISHRAYADALTALRVFEISLECLPSWVNTTQDLLDFSRGKKK
ncbi:3'-5' exonuclease [Helicobacter sp. 11S03491-1]|uniref:3'-5' exonuclease n=1 Tax=Helicobacter sp. 11S03491-1 TaxID=1476196 RepID=UPI000BA6C770|nr:3'-5' exonuclease [Helicobacter sp. 11S03491-1]PAF43014.1 DNA polymerase III subunit epsilon [Helicobacter sp. 11S03491-1]